MGVPIIRQVRKRSGQLVPFNQEKIANAIFKAAQAVGGEDRQMAEELADVVTHVPGEAVRAERRADDRRDPGHGGEGADRDGAREDGEGVHPLPRAAGARPRDGEGPQADRRPQQPDGHLAAGGPGDARRDPAVEQGADRPGAGEGGGPAAAVRLGDRLRRREPDPRQRDEAHQHQPHPRTGGQRTLRARAARHAEKQISIGMPIYDLEQFIFSKSNENSNIAANNPEAINLSIAENTLKQYALKKIFSKDVAEAHLQGMVHLHDLGYPTRVYCSSHSLEYLKKYGLSLLNLDTHSAPAKHARTLTGHLNTFLASMQAFYAGALGVGYINILYAPYLEGMDDKTMRQEAQHLVFSGSQSAFSRGGQTLFLDFNVHTGVPSYMRDIPAIGPGGEGDRPHLRRVRGDRDALHPRAARRVARRRHAAGTSSRSRSATST